MERKTKNNLFRPGDPRLFLAGLLVLTTLLLAACSTEAGPTETASKDEVPPFELETVETAPETLPPVQVVMPEYELTYAGELEELITVTEVPQTSDLIFSVKLSSHEERIFTLHFNRAEGELVTFVTDAAGQRIPVSFEMAVIPEGLSEADEDLFYTAQDAVNEIVASLQLK